MKDITEYLKEKKLKEIGFDISNEEECLRALSRDGFLIINMKNPSKK